MVVAAVVLGIVLLPGAVGGSDDEDTKPRVTRATLTLERARRPDTAGQELLVSLSGPQLNTPQINNGATVVWLRCLDSSAETVVRRPVDWPLIEEEGFRPTFTTPPGTARSTIRRCTLTGPGSTSAPCCRAHCLLCNEPSAHLAVAAAAFPGHGALRAAIAHAGHWAINLLYIAPIVIAAGVLGYRSLRDRRQLKREGSQPRRRPDD